MVHAPVLVVVTLLSAAFVVPLLYRKPQVAQVIFLVAVALAAVLSVRLALLVLREGSISYYLGGWLPPFGIEVVADAFSAYASLIIALIALPIAYFVVFAPREVAAPCSYMALILLLLAAMHGMVLAGDLFNLYVFIEICSLCAISIIAVKGTRDSIEASFRYLVLSVLGSGGILFAIALIFMISGHLNMGYIKEALQITASLYPLNLLAALSFLFVGFAVKAAIFPLHIWLPEAHSTAPTASSALLSGLVVKAYLIAFIRIIYMVLGTELFLALPLRPIFLVLASCAILVGSAFAIVQNNIKRMLAYSTVAQMGYIVLGFGLFSQRALEGSTLHILNHAITKSLLFLSAGVIIKQSGTNRLSELKGMGRKMPFTFVVFTIGAFSMVGIPGFAGFVSKLYLALGALDIGQIIFAVLILISSLLNATYYLPIVVNAFFGQGEASTRQGSDPKLSVMAPLLVFASAVIVMGLFPSVVMPLVRQAAALLMQP